MRLNVENMKCGIRMLGSSADLFSSKEKVIRCLLYDLYDICPFLKVRRKKKVEGSREEKVAFVSITKSPAMIIEIESCMK